MRKITIFLIFSTVLACAQKDRGLALKLYTQFNYSTGAQKPLSTLDTSTKPLFFYGREDLRLSLSPAIRLDISSHSFHEIAITEFGFEKHNEKTVLLQSGNLVPTNGGVANEFKIGLRYEYSQDINVFKEKSKLNFNMGMGASPMFYRRSFNPISSNSFPTYYTSVELELFIVPRLQYAVNDKWFVDLNIPFVGSMNSYETYRVENPAFSSSEQKNSRSTQDVLPKRYEARLGVGIKLI